jgi:hypothetical protein
LPFYKLQGWPVGSQIQLEGYSKASLTCCSLPSLFQISQFPFYFPDFFSSFVSRVYQLMFGGHLRRDKLQG